MEQLYLKCINMTISDRLQWIDRIAVDHNWSLVCRNSILNSTTAVRLHSLRQYFTDEMYSFIWCARVVLIVLMGQISVCDSHMLVPRTIFILCMSTIHPPNMESNIQYLVHFKFTPLNICEKWTSLISHLSNRFEKRQTNSNGGCGQFKFIPPMLKTEYTGFGVNTIPAGALAPKVVSASASMLLAVWDRQHGLLFQSWFDLLVSSLIQDTIQKWIYLS